MTRVLANLLVGSNLATTLLGSSKGLTFPGDRDRFHALRARSRAVLIGGATYRAEPYTRSKLPILVATRNPRLLGAAHPAAEFHSVPPAALIQIALERFGEPILIEGGINFIAPLMESKSIDQLHLTRSAREGDSLFFSESLLEGYALVAEEADHNADGSFQIWAAAR